MDKLNKGIGIALSGGGIRALIFHLGTLQYLAEINQLSKINQISTVSGASLCVALILQENDGRWPTDYEYLNKVLPAVKKLLLKHNISFSAIWRLISRPKWWSNRIGLYAKVFEDKWGIKGSSEGLPDSPIWDINCTNYETGKNFSFSKNYMGDDTTHYVLNPDFSISAAVAASAGVPIIIGPLSLDATKYKWSSCNKTMCPAAYILPKYHLWDGGIYDNLGIESLYNMNSKLNRTIEYLIVSDAMGAFDITERKSSSPIGNLKRLLNITMNEIGSLRIKEIQSNIIEKDKGIYIKIGDTVKQIVKKCNISETRKKMLIGKSLSDDEVLTVKNYPTTLWKPTKENYELILQHGYETTKCTCLSSKKFNHNNR